MITFAHKEFVRVLELAASGVAKREGIEQGDSFVFKDGKVYTFNNEVAVSCTLPPVPGVNVLEGAVNAKRMLAMMKAWGDASVSIGIKEGKELCLKGGRTTSGMKLQPEVMLAIGTEGSADPSTIVTIPTKEFVNAVKTVMPAASTDAQSPALCGVHIGSEQSGTYVEATDRTQVCRCYFTRQQLFDHPGFFIPSDAAKELVKFAPISVGTNGSWVHFDCGDCTLACRTLAATFPPVGKLMTAPDGADEIEFTHPIDDAVNRVALSAGIAGSVHFLTIEAKAEKKAVMLSGSSQYDWAKEVVEATSSADTKFCINIDRLREALLHSQALIVKVNADGGGLVLAICENTSYVATLLVPAAAESADAVEAKAKPKQATKVKEKTGMSDADDLD